MKRIRARRRALRAAALLLVLGISIGAAAFAAPGDLPSARTARRALDADVATEHVTAAPTATASTKPTPTPTPVVEVPEGVASGGDQPIGPQPATRMGSLPENQGVSPAMLRLRDDLAREIEAYRAQVGGIEVAVAVSDLQTGQTVSVNGNVPQRTGCTINLFALLALTGEFQAGRAQPGPFAADVAVGIGHSYPPLVQRFLQAAFGNHEVGVQRARDMMRSWGMQASLFDHVPYYGDGTQNNLLTALETNLALTRLYRGELFDSEWTAYALARLREIKPGLNYMLPGLLPPGVVVAHKIGYYWDIDGWVNADAGVVTFTGADGRTKAYVITYLSQAAPTEYTGYSFGARLSRVAWDWFHGAYGLQAPAPAPAQTQEATPTPRPARETPTSRPTRTPAPTRTPFPTATPSPVLSPLPSATPEATPEPVRTE